MSGTLVRIAGPTVVARGLAGAGLNEVVRVGTERLLGEVIRIDGDLATIQVYEETAGLALGEPDAQALQELPGRGRRDRALGPAAEGHVGVGDGVEARRARGARREASGQLAHPGQLPARASG